MHYIEQSVMIFSRDRGRDRGRDFEGREYGFVEGGCGSYRGK